MRKLTTHEKINIRAWLSRVVTGTVAKEIRVALPIQEVIYLAPRITGRSVRDLVQIQPPLVRGARLKTRPSDLTRRQRRDHYSTLQKKDVSHAR